MMNQQKISAGEIIKVLSAYKFKYDTELILQNGIEQAFLKANIPFNRELSISKEERPDFMVGNIAIEVKIQGSRADLLRQSSRYMNNEDVHELLIVGTPNWFSAIPPMLHGKRVYKLKLLGSMF